jgi:hypothetical protein
MLPLINKICQLELHSHNLTCIVRRAKNSDVDVSSLCHPFGNSICTEPSALNIHVILLLCLPLGRKMHENRGCVQFQSLEDVWTLVEVDHAEEQLIRIQL